VRQKGFGVAAALLAGVAGTACAGTGVPAQAQSPEVAASAGRGPGNPPAAGPSAADPESLWQSIRDEYRHGNLDHAHARAERARLEFAALGGRAGQEWPLKFRLLDAEILTNQRRSAEVVTLLSDTGARMPLSGDAAIQRDMLLGLAQMRLGRLPDARRNIANARRRVDALHSTLLGEVMKAQGNLALEAGDKAKAVALFSASLQLARARNDAYLQASDLVNIGSVDLDLGRYEQAALFSTDAARLARSIAASGTLDRALGNLGMAHLRLGDFEKALEELQEAEARAREIGLKKTEVLWIEDAGLAYFKLNDLEHARAYEEKALNAAEAQGATELIVEIRTNLVCVLYFQGHYDEALREAAELVSEARARADHSVMTDLLLVEGRIAARQRRDAEAERLLLRAHAGAAAFPSLKLDIENELANFYAARRHRRQAERWYARSLASFESQRAAVRDETLRLSFLGNVDTLFEDYADFLVATNRPDTALRVLDRSRARALEEGLGDRAARKRATPLRRADLRDLSRVLGAPLLFYALGAERSYLWTITADAMRLSVLPSRTEIRARAAAYRKLLLATRATNDPIAMASPDGLWLYERLVGPAADMIPPQARVYLFPDADLYGLNFETLLRRDASGIHYWIEDVTLTTASSLKLLAIFAQHAARSHRRESASDRDLLLIGDPLAAGSDFPALANAPTEIQKVRAHFAPDRQSVAARDLAVPTAYAASGPGRYRYIHFVAHGRTSRSSPLESAVVLSPPADDPESFMLYAHDIVSQALTADLVTVSACYGSGERAYAGEGLIGLAWAFLRAGSHHVISALWEVDDASTPRLMDALYEQLTRGVDPGAALRAAKLGLLRNGGPMRKPRYWAAFQLYAGA
jgi:CHAT domain-containing protein